jgi:hypothetical protein
LIVAYTKHRLIETSGWMSEEANATDCLSCSTHRAVLDFTTLAYAVLARKVVFRLQRIGASNIFGDDYHHKTVWDEYCYEVQNGPSLFNDELDSILGPILDSVMKRVPPQEAALLTIGAVWDLIEHGTEWVGTNPVIAPELIHQNLASVVAKLAGARDMSRFDPA